MTAERYETVGVIDAAAGDQVGDEVILVEHDDRSELLIAQPKQGEEGA